jgi:hypothetical protein
MLVGGYADRQPMDNSCDDNGIHGIVTHDKDKFEVVDESPLDSIAVSFILFFSRSSLD